MTSAAAATETAAGGDAPRVIYTAAYGVIGPEQRWVERPVVEVDARGVITRVGCAGDPEHSDAPARPDAPPRSEAIVHDLGDSVLLPGLVNAHSHAFQRTIRGATHARGAGDPSDFWSWRAAMYEAAGALDPEGVYAITRRCFAEMLDAGITCVGEFHYLHHGPDGTPYDDPAELSRQVIRAARDVGLRLALLEVYYARAGAGSPPLPEQRRFVDASVEAYLRRVETLRAEADGD
ncbi:MAG: amidohydrolase family protein, partial [Myxococcales bacterium]|nr:amidohydrolase family protein [Myxococcales bacterium]